MEAGAGAATGRSRGQRLRRRSRAVQRINMVFSIGNPPLREPAKSRCGGKDAQICISTAVSTGLYVPPCPSHPLVDADRSLRIAGQLGQRRDSSALALYGRPP